MASDQQREAEIAEIMQQVIENPTIQPSALRDMVNALASHRRSDWWFRTENEVGSKNCLSPMVLQNIKLKLEAGRLDPSMRQFKNILNSAIHYQRMASTETPTQPRNAPEDEMTEAAISIRHHIKGLVHAQSELIQMLDHLDQHGKVLRGKGGRVAESLREIAADLDLDMAAAPAVTDEPT
ncbi:hypothetical protein [Phaeobacter sp. C3_T13_0]|uniref:hypothetical protein n=1 Tax=Phaeobacter cretensis TaxID=3342641 RepID=UPI0039BD0E46